jgi:hypothetical protein
VLLLTVRTFVYTMLRLYEENSEENLIKKHASLETRNCFYYWCAINQPLYIMNIVSECMITILLLYFVYKSHKVQNDAEETVGIDEMLREDASLDETTKKGIPKTNKMTDSRGLTFIDGDNDDSDDDLVSDHRRTENEDDLNLDIRVGSYNSNSSSILDTPKACDM